MRYHRVRLHDAEDPQYRAFLSATLAVKSNQKASRPPSALSLFGGEAETITRDWLQTIHPLSDRRFVEYDERVGTTLIRKYRELDAVHVHDATHIHVYEIKASRNPRAVGRGMRQLRETQAILKRIIPHVRCTLVIVDTGMPTAADVAALMAGPDAPVHPPATLATVMENHPELTLVAAADYTADNGDLCVVMLPLVDVIARGATLGMELHLDWDESDDDTLDEPEPPPAVTYASQDADDGDDDNPFAAAFRNVQR